MPVQRPPVSEPKDRPSISVRAFFEEQLATEPVAFVPQKNDFSGEEGKKLGEEAEKRVSDMIRKAGKDIPGIQIVCFQGVRLVAGCPIKLREVDFCLFVTYQGNHHIIIMEVKCCNEPQKSRSHSKKAISQLRTTEDTLASELNIDSTQIHFHAVWPNLQSTEPCPFCQGSHPSLYERPAECRQPGKANPEPSGFHIFKDTFEGKEFSTWMRGIISDSTKTLVDRPTQLFYIWIFIC